MLAPPPSSRSTPRPATDATLRAATVAAMAAALLGLCGACATGEPRPPSACVAQPAPAESLVAGTGAAIAYAHAALRDLPVRVGPSIGSSGAVAAVRDGVVDVGLSLRPAPPPLLSHKLAEIPLVFASGRTSAIPPLSLAELERSLASLCLPATSPRTTSATPPARPGLELWVSREAGDSALQLLRRLHPSLAGALDGAQARGCTRVTHTDQEQHAVLAGSHNGVGVIDQGTANLAGANLRTWPTGDPNLRLALYALTGPQVSPRAQRALDALRTFAATEEARRAGYR